MRRRSGQSGQIVRKGKTWHVRFYVDVPGQRKRRRKSVPVGPAVGKEKLTKPEAVRKAAEIVQAGGRQYGRTPGAGDPSPDASRRFNSASSGVA